LLTGKFNQDNRPGEGDNRAVTSFSKIQFYGQAITAVEQLRPIADKYGKTTGQLALQWLLSRPGVASVIVGARNAEQVQGNLDAATFSIDEADLQANRPHRPHGDGQSGR
jgi:aryl-alcohol dehydrogenase-like predicted oxidoreductase